MAAEGELDFSRERKQVEDFGKSLDQLNAKFDKVNQSSLKKLQAELANLSVGGREDLNKMLSDLKGGAQELEGMLTKNGRNIAVVWKSVAQDTVAQMRKMHAELTRLNNIRIQEDKLVALEQAKAIRYGSSATVTAAKAAARSRAEGYTNEFGVYISKGITDAAEKVKAAESALHSRLMIGESGGVAAKAAARSRAEGYTNEFGVYISKGVTDAAEKVKAAEAVLYSRLMIGESGGVAAKAAARSRAEGYTNEFGVYISKGVTDAAEKARVDAMRKSAIGNTGRTLGGAEVVGQFSAYDANRVRNVKEFGSALRGLAGDMGTAHSAARGLASGFGLLWLTWGEMVPLMAGAALSFGLNSVVSMGAKVQDTLTQIKTLAGGSAEEVAVLNNQMLNLARTGPFGPEAVANAMKTLSLAGLDATKVYAAMPELLAFAVAGSTTIEQAADALTSIGTAFNIQAENYGYISDIISKTAAESKSSVESISEAFKTASVINTQYGVSLQDTAVGLALLANAGIQGSAAGTALRNMYADLSERTPKVAKAMKELGVSAIDPVTGKMRAQAETFKDLLLALAKYDPTSQSKAISEIFSERGGKEAVAILNAMRERMTEVVKVAPEMEALMASIGMTAESAGKQIKEAGTYYEELSNAIKESEGFAIIAAAEQSLTPLNQMKGVVASLQAALVGAFDSIQPYVIDLSQRLRGLFNSEEFRSGVQGFVTAIGSAITFVAENARALATLALGYVALNSVMKAAATGYVALTAAQAAMAAGAGRLGIALAAVAKNPLMLVLQAVMAAAAAWSIYKLNVDDAKKANDGYTGAGLEDLIRALEEEEDRLRKVNDAREQGISLLELEARTKAGLEQADFDKKVSELEEKAKPRQGLTVDQELERLYAVDELKKTLEQRGNLILQFEARMQGIRNERARQNTTLPGVVIPKSGDKVFQAAEEQAKAYRNSVEQFEKDNLASIASQAQSRIATITSSYNTERDILNNAHKNKLVDEGTFQATSLANLLAYEDKKLAALDEKDEAARVETARVYNANVEILDRELKQFGDNAEKKAELNRKFTQEVTKVAEKLESDLANSDQQRVELTNEKYKRMKLAAQDYAGEVLKIEETIKDKIEEFARNRKDIKAAEDLANKYAGVNENSVLYLRTQKAGEEAAVAAAKEADKFLNTIDKALEKAIKAREAFADAALASGAIFTVEGSQALAAHDAIVARLKAGRKDAAEASAEDIAAASQAAIDKVIRDNEQRLKDSVSDSIITGILEGGEQGAASLRKLIEQEIRKPLKVQIDAVISSISKSTGLSTQDIAFYGNAAMTATTRNAEGGKDYGQAGGQAIGYYFGGPLGSYIGGSIGKSLGLVDYAGTPHGGGMSEFSARGGLKTSNTAGAFGMGFGGVDRNDETIKITSNLAQGLVGILDSTAETFGKKGGYSVATGYADDKSPDGAWGGLLIKDGDGKVKVNWNDERTSRWAPREFASGEAGAKQYDAAVANDVRNLIKADVPAWADTALDGLGESTNLEDLVKTVAQINAMQLSVVALGRTSQSFADMSEDDIGKLISAMGGLEGTVSALGSYYGDYYTEAERSAAATASVSEQFTAMGKTMPASRDEFRAMMDAAIEAGDTDLAAKLLKLAPAMAAVARSADDIANERQSLQDQYDEMTGNTSALRARELAKLDPSNRALQQRIWALEDEQTAIDAANAAKDKALEVLRKAVEAERKVIQARIDAAAELVATLTGIFDVLQSNIKALRDEAVASTVSGSIGRAFIANALQVAQTSGVLPDQDDLQDAVAAARGDMGIENFTSTAEQRFAKLRLANDLSQLGEIAGDQLTAAEQAQLTAEAQLDALNAQLEYWETAIEEAKNGVVATMSVTAAVDALRALMFPTTATGSGTGTGTGSGQFVIGGTAPGMSSGSTARPVPAASTLSRLGNTYYGSGGTAITDQAYVGKFDSINSFVNTLDWSAGNKGASAQALLAAATTYGVTAREIAIATGYSEADILALNPNIPRFAIGTNYVPQDMLAYIHEGEAVVPKAYNPAAGGGTSADTARMEELLAMSVAHLAAVADATRKHAEQFDQVTEGGNAMRGVTA